MQAQDLHERFGPRNDRNDRKGWMGGQAVIDGVMLSSRALACMIHEF
jgi:hypothetical protein